jgi:hypothetical protein
MDPIAIGKFKFILYKIKYIMNVHELLLLYYFTMFVLWFKKKYKFPWY